MLTFIMIAHRIHPWIEKSIIAFCRITKRVNVVLKRH